MSVFENARNGSKSFSLVQRLINRFRIAFGFLMIFGLLLVWFFASFYLRFQEKQRYVGYVEILSRTLSQPLEFFDLADIDATLHGYSEFLKFQKIRVLDRYQFVQAELGDVPPSTNPDIQYPIRSASGDTIGTVEIWKASNAAPPLGISLFLGAGSVQMLIIAILGTLIMNSILRRELIIPLNALAKAINQDSIESHYVSTPQVQERIELNTLSLAYEAALNNAKNLLQDRHVILNHLTIENEARELQVRLIEESLRQSKMVLCYVQSTGSQEIQFFGGWAAPEVQELISALAHSPDNPLEISKNHNVEMRNLIKNVDSDITSWEAHFETGAIWLFRMVMLETSNLAIFASDETINRRLESALHHKNKLESLGGVASGVAHDFNNILAIISGAFEQLNFATELEQEFANHAQNAVKRGATIVRQLLQFVHINKIGEEPCCISELIILQEKTLPPLLGPNFSVDITAPKNLFVRADTDFLQTILINLAINSRDAFNKKEGKIQINLRTPQIQELINNLLDTTKKYIALDFMDNSSGIPAELKERVFEPFFSTKPVGQGTGLGLSMAFEFVNKMGGAIFISKSSAEGTCITIILRQTFPNEIASQMTTLAPKPELTKNKILVVDDEESLVNFIRLYFQKNGIEVMTCFSTQQAYEILNSTQVDIVISDMFMPDGTGLEILKNIRERAMPTKFILMSGNFQLDVLHQGSGLEAITEEFPFIEKPFKLDDLYNLVQKSILQN